MGILGWLFCLSIFGCTKNDPWVGEWTLGGKRPDGQIYKSKGDRFYAKILKKSEGTYEIETGVVIEKSGKIKQKKQSYCSLPKTNNILDCFELKMKFIYDETTDTLNFVGSNDLFIRDKNLEQTKTNMEIDGLK